MWRGGRWGREKADVGERRRARRSTGEVDKEGNGVSHGVALGDSVSFRTPHVRDTHASFSFSLSLQALPLFLSLPPSSFLPLSYSRSRYPRRSLGRALRPSRSFLVLSLRALTSRTTSRHVARALPPLAGHGAAPIGAPLPATTALQSAHGADR